MLGVKCSCLLDMKVKNAHYHCINDNYSWESESGTKLAYSFPKKDMLETDITSPVKFDLRTPQGTKSTKLNASKALIPVEENSSLSGSIVNISDVSSFVSVHC